MDGRCMKCQEQKVMADVMMTKTKRGTFMAKGKCGSCGTTICKIMSEADATKALGAGHAKKAF